MDDLWAGEAEYWKRLAGGADDPGEDSAGGALAGIASAAGLIVLALGSLWWAIQ